MKKFFLSFLATVVLTVLSINFVAAKTVKAEVEKTAFNITQTAVFPVSAVAELGVIQLNDCVDIRSNYFTAVNRNVAVEIQNIFPKVELIRSVDYSIKFSPPRFKRTNFNDGIPTSRMYGSIIEFPDWDVGKNFVKRE